MNDKKLIWTGGIGTVIAAVCCFTPVLVVLLGVVLQEILQAFRSERDLLRAADALAPFPLLQLSRSDYVEAARVYQCCRSAGIAASTTDCQIAAAAATNRCGLLSTDDDFRRIAQAYPLEVVRF